MTFTTLATIASFGGKLLKLSHQSTSTGTAMAVNLYLPPAALGPHARKVPMLFYLSGLTCTPDNCSEKGFLQHRASQVGLAIVYPDTSPRGLDLADEHAAYDFGSGAGFYVDATVAPYSAHYRMASYVEAELPDALCGDGALGACLDGGRLSIAGHSMGGHGALTMYLRGAGRWASVSAFAPIANPSRCGWGRKAFRGYLGEREEAWAACDATELVRGWQGGHLKMLVDVGLADGFYKEGQLLPENLDEAVRKAGLTGLTMRYHEGYDHSYYFVASFADDHVDHAAKHLGLL